MMLMYRRIWYIDMLQPDKKYRYNTLYDNTYINVLAFSETQSYRMQSSKCQHFLHSKF